MSQLIAQKVEKPAQGQPMPMDVVLLDYESRYMRRKVLTCANGDALLVDLPKAQVLDHGDRLVLNDGRTVEVIAAEEELIEVKADDRHQLTIIAYHLGNRHLSLQIEQDRLLLKQDHVIAEMLDKMQATTRVVSEPFHPEGGAYGLGRTHSHEH